jgi:molybdopterin-containing oxidoreductase family membrane subunit
MKTGTIQADSKKLYAWIAVLAVIIAGAAYAWTIQLAEGLGVTGLTPIMPWGLYVELFGFLLGIGGGALIVSAAMDLANVRSYAPISRISIAVGVIAAILGSVFIVGDLGRPERAVYFFTSPNLGSSMVWDMIFMILFIILAVGYGWFSMRADMARKRSPLTFGANDLSERALGRDRMMSRIFAGATVVAGALLANQASLTSWTLSEHEILEAFPLRILLAPLFLLSALASGVAALLLVVVIVSRFSAIKMPPDTRENLAKMLAVLVLLDLAVVIADMAIVGFRGRELLSVIMEGPYALELWSAIGIGEIVPLLILAYPKTRRLGSATALASLLSLAGVFLIRFVLLLQGTLYPHIAYPLGIPTQTIPQTVWSTIGNYSPTLIEVAASAGVLALGALLLTLAVKILPLGREEST